ncbi:Ger(x)C family spore germination protein [Marinicrinis sediminis]|uniref:Ger(X)C family spore germination protein n=1 Tax=Marinicrinis sediminis TaxID=1652465 RepID=A0ABW5R8D0_9BACL
MPGKMTNTISKMLCGIGVLLLCTSCWDRVEINDTAIVVATAIDVAPDNQVRMSVQVPLAGQLGGATGGGGGSAGSGSSYYVDSAIAPTLRAATAKLQKRMSRQLFYAHRRVFIISEAIAEKGIHFYFDALARVPENRLSAYVVISKGPAYELINAQPRLERFPAESIREITKSFGMKPMTLKNASVIMSQKGMDLTIPYMEVKENEIGIETSREINHLGYAQFKDERMVGTFTGEAEQGLLWLQSDIFPPGGTVKISKKAAITYNVNHAELSMDIQLEDSKPRISIRVDADLGILESQTNTDLLKEETMNRFKTLIRQQIEDQIDAALKLMQAQRADNIGIGNAFGRKYPQLWLDRYQDEWSDVFGDLDIQVTVHPTITRIGLIEENIIGEGGI